MYVHEETGNAVHSHIFLHMFFHPPSRNPGNRHPNCSPKKWSIGFFHLETWLNKALTGLLMHSRISILNIRPFLLLQTFFLQERFKTYFGNFSKTLMPLRVLNSHSRDPNCLLKQMPHLASKASRNHTCNLSLETSPQNIITDNPKSHCEHPGTRWEDPWNTLQEPPEAHSGDPPKHAASIRQTRCEYFPDLLQVPTKQIAAPPTHRGHLLKTLRAPLKTLRVAQKPIPDSK